MPLTPVNLSDETVHPYAAIFPMLDNEDLAALAADIKTNGLYDPILLDEQGRIVDGRNRFAACQVANVEPKFVTVKGTDTQLAALIISRNAYRRHMTTGARAMAVALILSAAGKRRNGRWVRGSVPTDNGQVSDTAFAKAMQRAGTVVDGGDRELCELVKSGRVELHVAVEKVKSPPPRRVAKKVMDAVEARRTDTKAVDAAVNEAEGLADQLDEVLDAVIASVTSDTPTEETVVAIAPDPEPDTGRAPSKVRCGPTADQRKAARARRDESDAKAMAKVGPIRGLIEHLDERLHSVGIADLTGKPRQLLVDDLRRHAGTIRWARQILNDEDGE